MNDLRLVRSVVELLNDAGFEVAVFGGWAEELCGLRGPGPHGDVDLLIIDAPLDQLAELLGHHPEIPAKRLPHKRAFRLDGVTVELFLAARTPGGVALPWWGEASLRLPMFEITRVDGIPATSAAALSAYRRARSLRPDGLWDYDFHPDEPDVRIFLVPPRGALRRDKSVVVTEARHGDHVLRHYAFADRWFKINVTTDLEGRPAVHGDDRFAFNCDIATPMLRQGSGVYAVDLFLDVLVDVTGRSCEVVDRDEFVHALKDGLVSEREASQAEAHLRALLRLVNDGQLVAWLHDVCPPAPSSAPAAYPMVRGPVPPAVAPVSRPSW